MHITSYEDRICRSCRPKSKLLNYQESLDGKNNPEKGWLFDEALITKKQSENIWGFIVAIIFIAFIGIIIAVSQESNDYRNESLPGRYGYSISKGSSYMSKQY